jgi:hypothetical protein
VTEEEQSRADETGSAVSQQNTCSALASLRSARSVWSRAAQLSLLFLRVPDCGGVVGLASGTDAGILLSWDVLPLGVLPLGVCPWAYCPWASCPWVSCPCSSCACMKGWRSPCAGCPWAPCLSCRRPRTPLRTPLRPPLPAPLRTPLRPPLPAPLHTPLRNVCDHPTLWTYQIQNLHPCSRPAHSRRGRASYSHSGRAFNDPTFYFWPWPCSGRTFNISRVLDWPSDCGLATAGDSQGKCFMRQ